MGEGPATSLVTVATAGQASDDAPPRSDVIPGPTIRARYEVISVEQAPVPDGGNGTDWCRYVLSCGNSRITGLHRGTLDEVTAFATGCAEDFNLRSATGRGKASVAYSKKKSL
jgi:hypothetical protein